MRNLLALALTSLLATQAIGCAVDEDDAMGDLDGDGKEDGYNVTWKATIPNIVPKDVHDYLERYQWGDYHIMFHMARKSFVGGERIRTWLKDNDDAPAEDQEGGPLNGLIFLTMHHAMIEHLRERWGDEPVTNDPDGRETFGAVLDGWTKDTDVIAAMTKAGIDPAPFKKAAAKAKPERFATLDEYGNFLQTTLKLSDEVDPNDSAIQIYDRSTEEGTGIHNSIHGMFQDPESPITVGDPSVNLSNIMFWRIHGWIEAQLLEYLAAKTLASEEQSDYDAQLERFRLHMQLHSDFAEHQHIVPRPTKALKKEMVKRAFSNDVKCADVDPKFKVNGCT